MVAIRKPEIPRPVAGDQLVANLTELLVRAVVEIYQDAGGVIVTVRPKRVTRREEYQFTGARLDDVIERALRENL